MHDNKKPLSRVQAVEKGREKSKDKVLESGQNSSLGGLTHLLTEGKSSGMGGVEPFLSIDRLTLNFPIPRQEDSSPKALAFYKIFHTLISNCEKEYNNTKLFENNIKYKDIHVSWGRGQASSSGNKLRYEFNPNKVDISSVSDMFKLLGLSRLRGSTVTRVDTAIDYKIPLNPLRFYHKNKQKHSMYWGKSTQCESVYFGSKSSDVFTRVYDKSLEQKESFDITPDGSWWRVEAEDKRGYFFISEDIKNPFTDLRYVSMPIEFNNSFEQKMYEHWINTYGIQSYSCELNKFERYRFNKSLLDDKTLKPAALVFNQQFNHAWKKLRYEMEACAVFK